MEDQTSTGAGNPSVGQEHHTTPELNWQSAINTARSSRVERDRRWPNPLPPQTLTMQSRELTSLASPRTLALINRMGHENAFVIALEREDEVRAREVRFTLRSYILDTVDTADRQLQERLQAMHADFGRSLHALTTPQVFQALPSSIPATEAQRRALDMERLRAMLNPLPNNGNGRHRATVETNTPAPAPRRSIHSRSPGVGDGSTATNHWTSRHVPARNASVEQPTRRSNEPGMQQSAEHWRIAALARERDATMGLEPDWEQRVRRNVRLAEADLADTYSRLADTFEAQVAPVQEQARLVHESAEALIQIVNDMGRLRHNRPQQPPRQAQVAPTRPEETPLPQGLFRLLNVRRVALSDLPPSADGDPPECGICQQLYSANDPPVMVHAPDDHPHPIGERCLRLWIGGLMATQRGRGLFDARALDCVLCRRSLCTEDMREVIDFVKLTNERMRR